MKPRPIDRLITILLSFNLLLALWWLLTTFSVGSQVAVNVS
jgi:hypothetical protein